MRSMYTLNQLAAELTRQAQTKRDYVANDNAMAATTIINDGGIRDVRLDINNVGDHGLTDHAHRQLGQHLRIPVKYYDYMRDHAPTLLCDNINHWLQAKTDETRLIRTLDGDVRGILSPSYRPLDNYDFAECALTELGKIEGIQVKASAITDTNMYIKAVNERMQGEIRRGDVVQWGISLSNSEVGAGSLRIDPLVYRLVCTNGAVARDHITGYSRRHRGKRLVSDLEVSQVLSDEARQADDTAFWLAVRDLIRNIFDQTAFDSLLETWKQGAQRRITQDVPITAVVQATLRHHKLPESMSDGVLRNLLRDDDLTQYGLGNAITRHSQDIDDYTVADNLEHIGADIMSYSQRDWNKLESLALSIAE